MDLSGTSEQLHVDTNLSNRISSVKHWGNVTTIRIANLGNRLENQLYNSNNHNTSIAIGRLK